LKPRNDALKRPKDDVGRPLNQPQNSDTRAHRIYSAPLRLAVRASALAYARSRIASEIFFGGFSGALSMNRRTLSRSINRVPFPRWPLRLIRRERIKPSAIHV
jgi:hypothetical protein